MTWLEIDEGIICCICEKPITTEQINDRHWLHEENCLSKETRDFSCECDLECHEECCPICKEKI